MTEKTDTSTHRMERVGDVNVELELLDPVKAKFFQEMGYTGVCKLNGRVVGIMQFLFTWGLCVGLDETGYSCRYCYDSLAQAAQGLSEWINKGGDEPPPGYIKRKG